MTDSHLISSSVFDKEKKFKFINCIGDYKITPENVNSATFKISRYGKHQRTIKFLNPISEKEAIATVEEYLSQPLTEDYYNQICDDLFDSLSWIQARECFYSRGECLTQCIFLEKTFIKGGNLTFFIGS